MGRAVQRLSIESGRAAEVRGLPVAVAAAQREELAALERRIEIERRDKIDGCPVVRGTLGGASVVLLRTGEGRENAARAIRSLLEQTEIARLVVIGFAGALCPTLIPGSVVVARRVLGGPAPDLPSTERLARRGVVTATLVSSERMLCTAQSKTELRERLDLRGPAVVDLETASIAAAAAEYSVPYLAVRAISDTVDESLPVDFNQFRDEKGGIDRFRVVRYALLRPRTIPALWSLRRRAELCSRELADVVCGLIEEVPA